MSSFRKLLKKQGGLKLLLNYLKSGVLFYAIAQIVLTGLSRKSLELVRYGVSHKIQKKLCRKYTKTLNQFNTHLKQQNLISKKTNKVWVLWLQGIDKAPAVVRRCYQSLKENLSDREIVLLTAENYKDYTDIPNYILEKYQQGLISHTHFSDLLRIELLCRHGGTWIDATVFCSGGNIPNYMLDSDFFLFQNLKPGADGSSLNISSWFITSSSNNKILLAVREMLWEYWKKESYLIDYFLLHHFIMIAKERYAGEWRQIVQFPNSAPHILLLMMFEPFDLNKWEAVCQLTPFHKLAYKCSAEDMEKKNTFFDYLMNP